MLGGIILVTRQSSVLTLTLLIASVLLGAGLYSPTFAQDDPTDQQLFEQFMQLVEKGDYQSAQKINLDVLRLEAKQRIKYLQVLQDLEQMADTKAAPATLLQAGRQAWSQGQPVRASGFYKAVLKNAKATANQKEQANNALASIRRGSHPKLSEAQAKIAQASGAIREGKLDEAEKLLQDVKASGVNLGWFENERIARQLELIGQIRSGKVRLNAAGGQATSNDSSDPLTRAKLLFAQEQQLLARQAERQGNYRLAVGAYEKILKVDPKNEAAAEGLASARLKANQRLMPRSVLQTELQQIRLRAAATESEFKELYNKANSLRERGNFVAASETIQQAKITLDRNQSFLSATRYNDLRENATALGVRITEEQQLAEVHIKQELQQTRQADAQAQRTRALADRDQQVIELLRRTMDLRREQKYARAIELLKQAKFLDPNNPAINLLHETMQDTLNYIRVRDLVRQRDQLIQRQSGDNTEATLPYSELMTFPADWPELTYRRLQSIAGEEASTSEINQQVEFKLREPIAVEFTAHKLETAIDFIKNITGVNFVINWTAMTNVGVEPDLPITLEIKGIPAGQALKLVMEQASAGNELDPVSYTVHDGLVDISTERDLKRKTAFLRSYDIRDLLVQVPTFDDAPSFNLSTALSGSSGRGGSSGGGGGGGGGGGSGGGGGGGGGRGGGLFGNTNTNNNDDDDDDENSREERVLEILELIRTQTGTQEDWVDFGGDVSSVRELNGILLIRTTPQTQAEVTSLLDELRQTRSMQISVEARFLLVDQNFLEEIGVDIDIQAGNSNDPTGFGATKIAQDTFGLTNRPLSTGLPGSFGSVSPALGALADFVSGVGFPGSGRSMDVNFFYIDDWSVNVMIRASQASRRAISLTAPRITFFNGQQAFVTVARQIAFISDLEPVPDTNGLNPTLSITQSGVVLSVEGTISADRRYVTLTVEPTLATIAEIRTITFTSATTDIATGTTGTTTTNVVSGAIEAPQLEITQLKTTVSVPDKGTLMLGGQRLVGEIEIEAGVPVLSKLPIINRLFTNRSKVKDERTLLVLIKPTIIIQTEEENTLFPGLEANPKQYNVGNRL